MNFSCLGIHQNLYYITSLIENIPTISLSNEKCACDLFLISNLAKVHKSYGLCINKIA